MCVSSSATDREFFEIVDHAVKIMVKTLIDLLI